LRATLASAAVIALVTTLPAYADGVFDLTGSFLTAYGKGEELLLRLYIKGVGDDPLNS
jgi:hypothetical protein